MLLKIDAVLRYLCRVVVQGISKLDISFQKHGNKNIKYGLNHKAKRNTFYRVIALLITYLGLTVICWGQTIIKRSVINNLMNGLE